MQIKGTGLGGTETSVDQRILITSDRTVEKTDKCSMTEACDSVFRGRHKNFFRKTGCWLNSWCAVLTGGGTSSLKCEAQRNGGAKLDFVACSAAYLHSCSCSHSGRQKIVHSINFISLFVHMSLDVVCVRSRFVSCSVLLLYGHERYRL